MMLFDPMDERTPEEIVTYHWHNTWGEEFKNRIAAAAEAQGRSWLELVLEGVNGILTEMDQDPEKYQQVMKRYRFASMPFGMDPLLRKDGE